MMNRAARILVVGATGMVGSAIVRALRAQRYTEILAPSRAWLDCGIRADVLKYFALYRPEYVFIAAARVGGILANAAAPADFMLENLSIAANLIDSAARFDTKRLLFLGSTCIYPKMAPQPLEESSIMTGALEPTNEGYAMAKLAGLKLCEAYRQQYGSDFITVLPTNLYGPGDNFDPESSHVIPGMIWRFHDAKQRGADEVTLWGTGTPLREFLHVDDCAEACVLVANEYEGTEPINIGCGWELPLCSVAELIRDVVGFKGAIVFDKSKPDGTPRKLTSLTKLRGMGWHPRVQLEGGIRATYDWFLKNVSA